jgi:hypothetical protein
MQERSANILSQSLLNHAERIIAIYRGWEAFERAHGGPQIIDFDLTNIKDETSFSSRREILLAFEELHGQLNNNSHEGEYLRDKLLGSIFYLRALLGQEMPFDEYVRHTLGITIKRFADEEINTTRNKVNELLSIFDLRLEEECREEFEDRLIIHDPEEIKRGIVENQEFWLARLREKGIPNPKRLDLRVEFASVDAYWNNWINGSLTDGITLRINIHPRKKYDLGRPLALCLHEICGHAVQMTLWKEGIAQGTINPACGLTTVHSPEAFIAEGLGQTVAEVLGDEEDFPVELNLSRWLHFYTLMILHNAHLMIYEGAPVKEIFHYAQSNLPFTPPLTVEAEIRDRSSDPLYRTYQLSYATGEHAIKGLIHTFTPRQKQRLFVEMYTRPMTPKQLHELGRRIADASPEP